MDPPTDVDLQFVYRAAQSIYWNPEARQLEDRYEREVSHTASFVRLAGAVQSEYGLAIRAAPELKFEGISEPARSEINRMLRLGS